MIRGRSTKGKRMVAEEGAGKVRSMKRKRRGEKLDRDDMKVIAGLSGGSIQWVEEQRVSLNMLRR